MKFFRVATTLDLRLSQHDLDKDLAASPHSVGEEIAEQVIIYEEDNKLGYYPAIEFLKQQEAIDSDSIKAIENISWSVSNLIREEITKYLKPVFSSVEFKKIQLHALTMPSVRPHMKNSRHELVAHFTPDHVHISLVVTLIKHYDDSTTAERMTKNMIHRWLNDHVDGLEITSVNSVDND